MKQSTECKKIFANHIFDETHLEYMKFLHFNDKKQITNFKMGKISDETLFRKDIEMGKFLAVQWLDWT